MLVDMDLYHALLNSVLMKFFVEAIGFGRGLGVLDINKESIANCFMLNPALLSPESISQIKKQFQNILAKNIMSIEDEFKNKEWLAFNRTVLRAFGIEEYYIRICNSLLSMRQVRKTACEVNNIISVKDIEQQHDAGINNYTFAPDMAAESRQKHG